MRLAHFDQCYMEYKTKSIYQVYDSKNRPSFDFDRPIATCLLEYHAEFKSEFFGNPENMRNFPDFSKHHWDLHMECLAKNRGETKKPKTYPNGHTERLAMLLPQILWDSKLKYKN